MKKIKTYILSHKIISVLFLLVVLASSYFIFFNKKEGEASYVTEIAKISDITTTVSGTGQVEASNTIDLKPKATGDISYVGVKAGDTVKKGKLIVSVDSRDAKIALLNARISLDKLTKDPDSLTLLQKENQVKESYNSAWDNISQYVTETTSLILDLEDIYENDGFLGYKNAANINKIGRAKINLAENGYFDSKESLKEITDLYKVASIGSDKEKIEDLLNKTYESSKVVSNTVKDTQDAFNYVVSYLELENDSNTETTRSSIASWQNTSSGFLDSLLSSINQIKENNESLNDTLQGEDELDIRQAELSLQSKQDSYNDCFLYAPFEGVIGTLTAKVGQSSGTSVGTLITKEKIVSIPFNEVDVSQIKIGQKAKLNLDAITGLEIPGTVLEIDEVGTVSSGVVTYNVKIAFDNNDERIKPGMSVSADVITNQKNDILTVSSSAVKTRQGETYVEVLNESGMLMRKKVEVGISDDSITEIVNGLNEGDTVVTRTSSGSISSSAPSILNSVEGQNRKNFPAGPGAAGRIMIGG